MIIFDKLFPNRTKRQKKHKPTGETGMFRAVAGVRNWSDFEYRGKQHEKLIGKSGIDQELLDSWIIEETVDQDGTRQYIPRPVWDDEAMLTRTYFPTVEEAEKHVSERDGKLL